MLQFSESGHLYLWPLIYTEEMPSDLELLDVWLELQSSGHIKANNTLVSCCEKELVELMRQVDIMMR